MKTNRLLIAGIASGIMIAGIGAGTITAAPNAQSNTTNNRDANTAPGTAEPADAWHDQMFDRVRHIQQEMDSLFGESFKDLGGPADMQSLFDQSHFDASSNVQDKGDHYTASFYFPNRNLANVKVTVKNDNVLNVNASSEQTTTSKNTPAPDAKNAKATAPDANGNATVGSSSMLEEYDQMVTLPGPVDSSKMTVDKHGDTLVVTLPKKNEGK